MELSVKAFWLQKDGNGPEEYEDAYLFDVVNGRFAVSDGATDSAFAQQWARRLVEITTRSALSSSAIDFVHEWLEPYQQKWRAEIPWEKVPGYARNKVRNGAFATVLGLEILLSAQGPEASVYSWRAVAVGDSCLFHIRADSLITSFPMEQSRQFNYYPPLVSSNPDYNNRICEYFKFRDGFCYPGDLFMLATDALAQWFLSQCEEGGMPWNILCDFEENCRFENFVTQLRKERGIHNDDTTVMVIHLLPD